jgi:peroxiredoxin
MAQFEPHKDRIAKAGSLVYVAAEKRGGLFKPEKYLAGHPISFPFLLDEDRAVTKQYGIYQRLGLDAINIARPSSFVIDASGLIRLLHMGTTQTDRAPVEQVLAALESASTEQPK